MSLLSEGGSSQPIEITVLPSSSSRSASAASASRLSSSSFRQRYTVWRGGRLALTVMSTEATLDVIQPLRFARAVFLRTKNEAASLRRLSSLFSASAIFFSATSSRASTTSNASSCSFGLLHIRRRRSDGG